MPQLTLPKEYSGLPWIRDIGELFPVDYDGIEINAVFESPEETVAVFDADEPWHFWSVYLHLVEGGVECIADFATQGEAVEYANRLLSEHESLQKHGISLFVPTRIKEKRKVYALKLHHPDDVRTFWAFDTLEEYFKAIGVANAFGWETTLYHQRCPIHNEIRPHLHDFDAEPDWMEISGGLNDAEEVRNCIIERI